MMEQELATKRVEFIQTMKESMIDMDVEGNEIKFFSSKFLVQKYLKLSDADLKLNDKLKQEEIEELNLAGDPDNTYDDGVGAMESQKIDYDKLANLIVEKMANKSILTEQNSKTEDDPEKDTSKKKKTTKSKKTNKEEE
jgi:hypothetical protein